MRRQQLALCAGLVGTAVSLSVLLTPVAAQATSAHRFALQTSSAKVQACTLSMTQAVYYGRCLDRGGSASFIDVNGQCVALCITKY